MIKILFYHNHCVTTYNIKKNSSNTYSLRLRFLADRQSMYKSMNLGSGCKMQCAVQEWKTNNLYQYHKRKRIVAIISLQCTQKEPSLKSIKMCLFEHF